MKVRGAGLRIQALPRRLRRSAFSARSFSESSLRSCLFSSSSLMRSAISSMTSTEVATGAEETAATRGVRLEATFGVATVFSALTDSFRPPWLARLLLSGGRGRRFCRGRCFNRGFVGHQCSPLLGSQAFDSPLLKVNAGNRVFRPYSAFVPPHLKRCHACVIHDR